MRQRFFALAACLLASTACRGSASIKSQLTVELVSTGWRDGGAAAGRNKIVPSAAVKILNVSGRTLPSVQLNAVFHRLGEGGAWGTAFATAAGSSGLTPGGAATVTLNSERGYTGEDEQNALLTNSQFVDATVDVFAKYGSEQWTRVGEYPIDRQLLKP
jgi:hypothetical protein